MRYIIVALILLGFSGCGYTPSSKFSRQITGENISTSVDISAIDPENTVIIKDAVDGAIIEVFHASLSSRATSDSHLNLSISAPSYAPTVYDENGFVVGYRMRVNLTIVRYHDGVSRSYATSGTHDFSVSPNAIVTDQERFEAIRFSAAKAIHSFIAQVSADGARAKKNSEKKPSSLSD